MTVVGISFPIEACKGGTSPKSIEEFQRLLWEKYARPAVRTRVKRPAYEGLFARYLDAQAALGISSKRWTSRDGKLWFSFSDNGGACATSMAASVHFMELGVALSVPEWGRVFVDEGWRVMPERNALSLLTRSTVLLIELRNTLYQAALADAEADAETVTLTADEGAPALTFEALSPAEQTLVRSMVTARQCCCQLCEFHRPRLKHVAERVAERFALTQAKDRLKATKKAQKLR